MATLEELRRNGGMSHMTVWLDEELWEYIEGVAARQDRPKSRLVRQLVREAVEARQKKARAAR
jgi:predicted transcriptional regulator